jgi:hypothetical protein
MLVIEGRSVGRREPLFADFSVALPPAVDRGSNGITLRELLAQLVRHEVAAFDKRQSDRSVLRVLTEREIGAAQRTGKIAMGESEVPRAKVDVDTSTAVAWQAFEDGIYLVLLDGVEQKELDRQVFPKDDSRLTLVRLTLLAGG